MRMWFLFEEKEGGFRNGGGEACRRILERRSAQTALLFSALYWRPRFHEGMLFPKFPCETVEDCLACCQV